MECEICCEKYTKTKRKEITCPYCEYTACLSCYKIFILDSDSSKCMSCDNEFTRYFLSRNLPASFMRNEFKIHRENVLLEQEKTLMPETQRFAVIYNMKPSFEEEIKKLEEENRILSEQYNQNAEKIYLYNRNIKRINRGNYDIEDDGEEKKSSSSYIGTQPCRNNDCRGFLDSSWVCGLCSNRTCRYCFELIEDEDEEHKCEDSNIESANLIKKETKPCPNCHSLIYKISGCDQMWCTVCHIAFSWKTGKQEQTIHNPHYFAWVRESGNTDRTLINHDCAVLSHNHADIISQRLDILPWSKRNRLVESIRNMIHNNYYNFRIFNGPNYFDRNRDLRVKYLVNEITEDELKVSIQRNDKQRLKYNEINQVIELMKTVFLDIINRFIDAGDNNNTVIHELDEIRLYCNNLLKDISKTYKSVRYKFEDNFIFH